LLAGSSDDTSQPAPKAMSPAAIGLPWVCWRSTRGVSCTVSCRVPAAFDAASRTPDAAADAASAGLRSGAAPITFSFHRPALARARSTRRSTMRPGVTFSVSRSTSELSPACVRSISRRIVSGSLDVVTAYLLAGL
jgi:hypothetical protein